MAGVVGAKMMQVESAEVGAFGKLPWAGDFLSSRTTQEAEPFLEWLEQGVGHGSARGEAWKSTFDSGAQKGFVFRLEGDKIAAGVIAPSRDAVGRRFPFSIYSVFSGQALGSSGHVLPLLLGNFLHVAGSRIETMRENPVEPAQLTAGLPQPDLSAISAHHEAYVGWTREAGLRMAGQAIFGANWRDALADTLYVLIESTRPVYGRVDSTSPLSVRVPVGAGLAGATALWMHIFGYCAGWGRSVPSAVWSFDPDGACVTLFSGRLTGLGFADLWEPRPMNDSLSDLVTAPTGSSELLAQSRPDLAALIQSDTALVSDLLTLLAHPRG